MTEDSDAVGSVRSSNAQRTAFAVDSLNFNMRDKSELLRLFPTHVFANSPQDVLIPFC
jgi:hypothetical protein